MRIQSIQEITNILARCRAIAVGDPSEGEGFYRVKKQIFRYPDGKLQAREYIDKAPASVVVPITEDGCVVFIIQPVGLAEEGALLECPAGYWNFDENGQEAALREMAEETGYTSEDIRQTGSHYQDPGSIRQKVATYVANRAVCTRKQKLDRGEFVVYIEVPIDLLPELINHGLIQDANTLIALFLAKLL